LINVLALLSDKGALGQYRVTYPAQAVAGRNAEFGVHAEATNSLGVEADRVGSGLDVRKVFVPGGVDVISFQRPVSPGSSDVIAWLRRNHPRLGIVVDVDADMPFLGDDSHLKRAISMADVLTVSTQAQKDAYAHPLTYVIRDSVPSSYLSNPARALSRKRSTAELDADRILGTSTLGTGRPYDDLEAMEGALADVVGVDRTGGRRVLFRTVGEKNSHLRDALGIYDVDLEASGNLPLNLQRVALGELDIAVVPQIEPGSALKALEFAAAGVPVVASSTPEHLALQNLGMPLWLVKPRRREWLKAIRGVLSLDDTELRDLARQHRENVRQNHTTERRAAEWAKAWRAAAIATTRKG
jgi:glycosyltransferase involved in cell wall biosynthesis